MAKLRQTGFPVVITERDLVPGTWREMLAEAVRSPFSPFLVVTSHVADERLWAEALNVGAYDVLAKPFDMIEVIRALSHLTGEGQTTPLGTDGKIAAAAPYPAPVLPVTVTIGGQPATYAYAGAAPGEVAGAMQINAMIPAGVTGNAVPVSVQIGTVSTQNGLTIAVQ